MIRRELHIDVSATYGSAVLAYAGGNVSIHSLKPDFVLGDHLDLRLVLWQREASGTYVAADPGASATIVLSGKPAAAAAADDVLFTSSDFAEAETGVWDGTLNLNTAELAAHLAATPAGDKVIRCELEIRNSGNTRRISVQFEANARPQVLGDEGTPTPLPTPDEWLATRAAPKMLAGIPTDGANASCTLQWLGIDTPDGSTLTIGSNVYTFRTSAPDAGEKEFTNATDLQALLEDDPLVFAASTGFAIPDIHSATIKARLAGTAGNSIAISVTPGAWMTLSAMTGGVNSVPQADFAGQIGIAQFTPEVTHASIYIATTAGHTVWHPVREGD